ncbi:hypothetical protein S7711_06745 [Stachybotrys chartarum IBT 7711]|uniref:Uncharacterized protein n=1 Tax=Stachybotrys chartarum (strain CBS 109288 / IBT 7711) TaxID=1280523 RepID=A0A084B5T6_STACB|nr:hypothetical protein S7711_06745 [Stachybotrys chartarum IBT 7711]
MGQNTDPGRADSGFVHYAQSSLDRIVSPASRQAAYDTTTSFAVARPILFAFVAAQLVLSFIPILLFTTFALSVVAFALGAALLFALFWIGVALLVLVPTLLVTASLGLLLWAWAVGSFVVARWLYEQLVRREGELVAEEEMK